MSDTMAAVLILPVLIALVIALECARTGCTWLHRRIRDRRAGDSVAMPASVASAQDY
jgi:hypothetical protein